MVYTGEQRYAVRTEKNALIPMPDGVRLAADLFLPDAPGRFPVILEYLPYRKDDRMAYRQQRHHYYAERGFACAWVDIRGTGASGGVAADEYTRQEQGDALEIIAWLAAQPWSNGKVGMTGISYGGFNAIQVAMRRPPALKAIVPAYATDDRYSDDIHYYGGAMCCLQTFEYPLQMVAMNALPPHPEIAGADWAALWEEHLRAEPWLLTWLGRQLDDDYWRHGSLRPDYGSVEAATLMICGWADGYRNWPLRSFAALRCPKKAIIGPWGHQWPDVAYPGPRIDYLHETARWFAQWLGGEETGIMDEPPIALYVQDSHPPVPSLVDAPGAWRSLADWPPAGAAATLHLHGGALLPSPATEEGTDRLEYLPVVGTCAPLIFYGGAAPGLQPTDQRPDEAYSLVYTGEPLASELTVIGYPAVVLHAASTAEVAFFSVKLSDVAPDGSSTLVTRGLLNATRRDPAAAPSPLIPGEVYELRIGLDCIAHRFASGHRLRLSVAGSDWPNVWPAPAPGVHTVGRGPGRPSRLELPLAPPDTLAPPRYGPPPALLTVSPVESSGGGFQVIQDVHEERVTVRSDSGTRRATMPYDGSTLTSASSWSLSASRAHPARASARGTHTYTLATGGGETRVVAMADIQGARSHFQVVVTLEITVDGTPFHHRRWARTIRRALL